MRKDHVPARCCHFVSSQLLEYRLEAECPSIADPFSFTNNFEEVFISDGLYLEVGVDTAREETSLDMKEESIGDSLLWTDALRVSKVSSVILCTSPSSAHCHRKISIAYLWTGRKEIRRAKADKGCDKLHLKTMQCLQTCHHIPLAVPNRLWNAPKLQRMTLAHSSFIFAPLILLTSWKNDLALTRAGHATFLRTLFISVWCSGVRPWKISKHL